MRRTSQPTRFTLKLMLELCRLLLELKLRRVQCLLQLCVLLLHLLERLSSMAVALRLDFGFVDELSQHEVDDASLIIHGLENVLAPLLLSQTGCRGVFGEELLEGVLRRVSNRRFRQDEFREIRLLKQLAAAWTRLARRKMSMSAP